MKLPKDRTTRILLAVVITMGIAILAGTAVLIVALIDLLGQSGSPGSAALLPAVAGHA